MSNPHVEPAGGATRTGGPVKPIEFLALFAWFAITGILLIAGGWPSISTRKAAVLGLLVFMAALLTLGKMTPARVWSPTAIFLIVVAVFHLGLTPFWILGMDPYSDQQFSGNSWFYGELSRDALYLVAVGISAYAFGSVTAILMSRLRAPSGMPFVHTEESDLMARRFSDAGAIVLLAAAASWFVSVFQQGGFALLFGSYSNFLAETRHLQTGIHYSFIAIGLGLLMLAPIDRALSRLGMAGYVLFAIVAFFLGLRGEVLFPLAVAVTVAAFRRRLPRPIFAFGGGLILLVFINAAREIRKEGLSSNNFDWAEASPLGALREMGGSIKIVATSISWHDYSGEAFERGATYAGVVARFFELVFSPHSRPPAQSDFRLMNVEVASRIGPAGGSIIGEAHHNFSVIGVAAVLLLVGLFFGSFSGAKPTTMGLVFYVIIAAPLFGHVRNSFVPVIPAVFYGALLVVAVILFGQMRRATDRSLLNRVSSEGAK